MDHEIPQLAVDFLHDLDRTVSAYTHGFADPTVLARGCAIMTARLLVADITASALCPHEASAFLQDFCNGLTDLVLLLLREQGEEWDGEDEEYL
jgi:hypothetical protein